MNKEPKINAPSGGRATLIGMDNPLMDLKQRIHSIIGRKEFQLKFSILEPRSGNGIYMTTLLLAGLVISEGRDNTMDGAVNMMLTNLTDSWVK